MTPKLRWLLIAGIALVLLSVWFDPYSHTLDGSDGIMSAPGWQLAAARMDLLLLGAAGLCAISGRLRLTVFVLGFEFLWAVVFNSVLVSRDGFVRFIWGFGATRHYVDFAVIFALRVLMLVAASNALQKHRGGAASTIAGS